MPELLREGSAAVSSPRASAAVMSGDDALTGLGEWRMLTMIHRLEPRSVQRMSTTLGIIHPALGHDTYIDRLIPMGVATFTSVLLRSHAHIVQAVAQAQTCLCVLLASMVSCCMQPAC